MYHVKAKAVWEYINPDGKDTPAILLNPIDSSFLTQEFGEAAQLPTQARETHAPTQADTEAPQATDIDDPDDQLASESSGTAGRSTRQTPAPTEPVTPAEPEPTQYCFGFPI